MARGDAQEAKDRYSTVCLRFPCFVMTSSRVPAIIGGGIGGSSCAHFLRRLFSPPPSSERGDDSPSGASLTVFERGASLGGRAAAVTLGGYKYEVGANRLHTRNAIMRELVKTIGKGKFASAGLACSFVLTGSSQGSQLLRKLLGCKCLVQSLVCIS